MRLGLVLGQAKTMGLGTRTPKKPAPRPIRVWSEPLRRSVELSAMEILKHLKSEEAAELRDALASGKIVYLERGSMPNGKFPESVRLKLEKLL